MVNLPKVGTKGGICLSPWSFSAGVQVIPPGGGGGGGDSGPPPQNVTITLLVV